MMYLASSEDDNDPDYLKQMGEKDSPFEEKVSEFVKGIDQGVRNHKGKNDDGFI